MTSKRTAIHPRHNPGLRRFNRHGDLPDVPFDYSPMRRRERYHGDFTARNGLFIFHRLVARDENIESASLGRVEQFPVFQSTEAYVLNRRNIMLRKRRSELARHVLV